MERFVGCAGAEPEEEPEDVATRPGIGTWNMKLLALAVIDTAHRSAPAATARSRCFGMLGIKRSFLKFQRHALNARVANSQPHVEFHPAYANLLAALE
jgi:hypothetical protein